MKVESLAFALPVLLSISVLLILALEPQPLDAEEAAGSEPATADSSNLGKRGAIRSTLSKANPIAATEQTVDVVRWMKKRRQFTFRGVPYGVTGLPLVYFSPNTGWNWGGRAHWVDYSQNRRPYRYKLTFHFQQSEKGARKFIYRLLVPRISGTGWGLRLQANTATDFRTRFYGTGNETENNKAFSDPNSPLFKSEDYYFYVLKKPRFLFSLLREIHGPLSAALGFGIEQSDVSQASDLTFVTSNPTLIEVKDGVTGFFSVTVQWDSRDEPAAPSRGTYTEYSYENSRNSLIGLFFDAIDFRRYTFTDSRHFTLFERLILANRLVLENLNGTVPLYAYGEIGGSNRIKGLGGSDSLRGFDKQRFTDDVRLFTNTELRYRAYSGRAFKQFLEWEPAIFVDSGRVWGEFDVPGLSELSLAGFHWTAGLGSRLIWNRDFVIRTDLGFSVERAFFTLKYRHLF